MIQISNVARQNAVLLPELMGSIQEVILSGQYIKGHYLEQLEMEMAQFHGVKHCIGVNSGTDAIYLALKAAEVGAGHEVIVPAMTFVATAEAVALTGAKPVFVDITDDGRDLIDTSKVRAAITNRTKAIIPVHLHGYVCAMNEILKIAQEFNLVVIEDCAQATGAFFSGYQEIEIRGEKIREKIPVGRVGTIGHAGAFSFFPTKNLGCIGDGGCILTDEDALAAELREYREHGGPKNNPNRVAGNSRLDSLQAAILSIKLQFLDEWNATRQVLAKRYQENILQEVKKYPALSGRNLLTLPPLDEDCVFHHYALRFSRVATRDWIQSGLKNSGVESISYYPTVIPLMTPYQEEGQTDRWKGSEAYLQSQTGLALPMFPEMTELELGHVCKWLAYYLNYWDQHV